jgi:small subunit ribosomal protein S21
MIKLYGRKVFVKDDNIDKALRQFKKKIQDIGLLQELQARESYTKPTVQKKLAKSQAKRRWKKYLRDQQLPKKYF